MPLPKPKKGESQDDFVSRCMSEAYGSDAPDDRTQEQAVAMCMQAWRDKDKKSVQRQEIVAKIIANWKEKFGEDPSAAIERSLDTIPFPEDEEDYEDFMDRCTEEALTDGGVDPQEADDACEEMWSSKFHKPARVRAKGKKVNKQDAPPVSEGEDEDDYLDRCLEEMTQDQSDMTEEEIMAECQAEWEVFQEEGEDEYFGRRFKQRTGITQFKTHSEEVQGMEFVLSDETPDRMGDVISSTGWDLGNFLKNPIALFNHNSNFPIGRWHNLRVEKGGLRGRLEVAPKGTSQRIDEIRKLIDVGILRAVSVGFRPVEQQPRKGEKGDLLGLHFVKQELVETSLVSVPANPNALAVAKSLDISPATIDFVFAGSGDRGERVKRRFDGGSARTHRTKRRASAMTLAQRIIDVQAAIVDRKDALAAHWAKIDDSNVSDADLQKTNDLNAEISRLEKQHSALVDSEKLLGKKTDGGNGKTKDLAVIMPRPTITSGGNGHDKSETVYSTVGKKDLDLLDLLVRGGTVAYVSRMWGKSPAETCEKIYGDHEATKLMTEIVMRAASAPAMTTVTGWAAELVQQTYTAMMETLMPKSILTRLAAKGLSLSFGRAGKINIPTRSRTPSIAGSFVGEGQAIPVRQGAFTSQALTPKKMAVITTWTREMDEHSIPAIEGILREAIQTDTTVAVDSVLIDAGAATVIRPAGLLNGVAAQTATTGGGIAAVVGDLKLLIGALTTATYGNIRNPVWLMNPAEMLSLSLINATNTGVFPFAAEVAAGNLRGVPIIDSGTVPAKTVILIDAADFVVVGGEAPRFEMSDQATLHMEDTTPLDLVGPGSPGTVAAPQRSLFQTDSLALRMIMPLNWANRRSGTVAWTQNVTW